MTYSESCGQYRTKAKGSTVVGSEPRLFLVAPVFSSLKQRAIHVYIPNAHVGLDWALEWAIKKKPHDGGLGLPLGNGVESVTNPGGDRCHWNPSSRPPPSHRRGPLPTLELAAAWTEENAADILPHLQERTWDEDSTIRRGRQNVQEDKG